MKNTKFNNEQIKELVSQSEMKFKNNNKIVSSIVRCSFPKILTPSTYNGNTKYESSFIIPDEHNTNLFLDYVEQFAGQNNIDFMNCQAPIFNQSTYFEKGYKGFDTTGIFFKCSSKFEVPVVDINRQKINKEDLSKKLYGGVWCLVSMSMYRYEIENKTGIGFNLRNIMVVCNDEKLSSGDRLGGKDFKDIKIVNKFDSVPSDVSTVYPVDGFSPLELSHSGWSREDMLQAGYTVEQLNKFNIV